MSKALGLGKGHLALNVEFKFVSVRVCFCKSTQIYFCTHLIYSRFHLFCLLGTHQDSGDQPNDSMNNDKSTN